MDMPTPEELRVTIEIFRLCDAMKLRLLEGVNLYNSFTAKGDDENAVRSIKDGADTVIRMRNRVANSLSNPNIDIAGSIQAQGYTVAQLKIDINEVVLFAQNILNKYPNINQNTVDGIVIRKPELVNDSRTKEL